MEESPELEVNLLELRAAMQEHFTAMRDAVANLALNIAAQDESKAPD